MSIEQYVAMTRAQNGKCAVCGMEPNILYVDHDHKTGRVRGLLCNGCNRAAGFISDSARTALALAEYLR